MIAFKGFDKDLSCTMGHGIFRYEIGKTYKEEEARCARTGFHCVEEPIEVLRWYRSENARYCVVEAAGDIHEDGDDKISCTEMRLIQEISIIELALLECKYLQKHPLRKYSDQVYRNVGCTDRRCFAIARGKNPKAKGAQGSFLFLLKEARGSKDIVDIAVLEVDGKEIKADTYYRSSGKEAR